MSTANDKEQILEDCLANFGDTQKLQELLSPLGDDGRKELQSLLDTAEQLRNLPAPEPSIQSVMKLVAKSEQEQRQSHRLRIFNRNAFLKIAASVLVIFFLTEITVLSAANATPGDFLYPIKLLTERIKFFVTFDQADKAELHIVFSGERLKELVKKYTNGQGVDKTLFQEMLAEAQAALDSSQKLPTTDKSYVQKKLSNMTLLQHKVLSDLEAETSDPKEQKILAECSDLCKQQCKMMNKACPLMPKEPHPQCPEKP